jgi:hypothetical protein
MERKRPRRCAGRRRASVLSRLQPGRLAESATGLNASQVPVIQIEKIADGPLVPFAGSSSPLENIQVLDFSHVLAGPRSTRSLAEYGAEVLHVSSPAYPDTLAQHPGVDIGKRCTYLDPRNSKENATMHHVAAEADVFASTYRSSLNQRFGLTPIELAAQSQRGHRLHDGQCLWSRRTLE